MNFFSRLQFRNKLLMIFLSVLIPFTFFGSTIAYYHVKKILLNSIEKELRTTNESLLHLIETVAHVSVKNRLRAIAEKNLNIAQYFHGQYQQGLIDREQAFDKIRQIFLNQSVGKSGYIYCLDSRGVVVMHPEAGVEGTDVSGHGFVKEQLRLKTGYIEYDWKNPGEIHERPKALYMIYFEPFDWIISASSYREEFKHLVDIADFDRSILSHQFGQTGYGYVMNEQGVVLIHPEIKGLNILEQERYPSEFARQMLERKEGKIRYFWKNPNEPRAREKIVVYNHLPGFQWIIACSSYVEEVFAPLDLFRNILILIVMIFLALALIAAFMISRTVTRPVEVFMDKLEQGAKGDFSVRMDDDNKDEFGKLALHFNSFMSQLENSYEVISEQTRKSIEARNALVENDLKLRSLFNQSFQITGILSPSGILEEINQTGLSFTGNSLEEVVFKPFWELPWWRHDEDVMEIIEKNVLLASQGRFSRFETTIISRGGEVSNLDISMKPILNSASDVAFIITEGRDITEYRLAAQERKNLAVQMEKAQKMESIGTLAGGIAHDFNNILSGILGYAQLAELNLGQPAKAKGHIQQILKGSRRAARLTQQILTFSRQQEFEKVAVDLSLILKEALKLLRSSIPVTIDIVQDIQSELTVLADPTQMHQVILNLCTNAYQAMGAAGGTLTVRLSEIKIERGMDFFEQVMNKGRYVELEVTDTGAGMDKDIMLKAFDPYFTTKEVGKGTGFGLALVHAIIDEHDGYIKLASRKGKGSSFLIFLPVLEDPDSVQGEDTDEGSIAGGSEHVMVVDDEEDIRLIVSELLKSGGYSVETFDDGSDAWKAFQEEPGRFDLIITDMTMPNMTGDELAVNVLSLKKNMPVIICTGYSETISEAEALELGIRRYVQKPLTKEELSVAVRDVLDRQDT